jgi:hypothetical protein
MPPKETETATAIDWVRPYLDAFGRSIAEQRANGANEEEIQAFIMQAEAGIRAMPSAKADPAAVELVVVELRKAGLLKS